MDFRLGLLMRGKPSTAQRKALFDSLFYNARGLSRVQFHVKGGTGALLSGVETTEGQGADTLSNLNLDREDFTQSTSAQRPTKIIADNNSVAALNFHNSLQSGAFGADTVRQAMVAAMTAFYVRPPLLTDGTRQHGFVKLVNPLVNWLAGTTDEWMTRSIPKDAVEGGFVARVQIVRGQRDYSTRYPRMLYPEDYEEVKEHLKQRIEDLLLLQEGQFELDDEAVAVHDEWYINARPPDDSVLLPAFNRADALIYKLALLLALAEWPGRESVNADGEIEFDCAIRAKHVEEAIDLWNSLVFDMPQTIKVANASPQSADVELVRAIIVRARTITRSALMQKVGNRGINKDRLDKALETLFAEDMVKDHSVASGGPRPKVWYTWEGKEEVAGCA